jgi:hypothetical protein
MNFFKKILSSTVKNQDFPLQVTVTIVTPATDLCVVTFDRLAKINSLYLRQAPSATAQFRIHGDEFGPRVLTTGPQIEFIGFWDSEVLGGTPTITAVQNCVTLVTGAIFFFSSPWLTRNLYLTGTVAGTYGLNLSYAL